MNIYPDSRMSIPEFTKLSGFIYSNCGIKLPITKKTMLEGRLHKRLRVLGLSTFKDYSRFLFSAEGIKSELFHMIDVVTTNKTDFFREAAHFEYLANHILPSAGKENVFNVWSAGCSSGEEPYTLAMVLNDFAERNTGFNYNIFGTDISGRVLQAAATAVYAEEKVAPVPLSMKRKYLLKSKNATQKTVRIVPELRSKVTFDRLNFIDGDFSTIMTFNVIFCRNVLIYFDRATQEKVIYKLCKKLEPGGILFLGHSESIANMNLPLTQIQPTTFRKI
ncbi:MAG TPA: CheR family methyltransferase [Pedobacter sp.]|jgi:chemotaxis protein methyltransferase CheR